MFNGYGALQMTFVEGTTLCVKKECYCNYSKNLKHLSVIDDRSEKESEWGCYKDLVKTN